MKIKVGIVEDDRTLATYYQGQINRDDNLVCNHLFHDAESAIESIPESYLDVVLMDIGLPNISGIGCLARLKPLCPTTEFVILTSYEDSQTVFEALKIGATGYLTKTDSMANILAAIKDVSMGGSPMSSHIARMLVAHFHEKKPASKIERLTLREQEIVEHLSKGFRYKEIGDLLYISTETVRTHIRNIYEKLQVNSRTDALNKLYNRM